MSALDERLGLLGERRVLGSQLAGGNAGVLNRNSPTGNPGSGNQATSANAGVLNNNSLTGNAGPGEWVEARVQVMRAGRSIVFTDCKISCDKRPIAQASAQFQVTGEPMPATP